MQRPYALSPQVLVRQFRDKTSPRNLVLIIWRSETAPLCIRDSERSLRVQVNRLSRRRPNSAKFSTRQRAYRRVGQANRLLALFAKRHLSLRVMLQTLREMPTRFWRCSLGVSTRCRGVLQQGRLVRIWRKASGSPRGFLTAMGRDMRVDQMTECQLFAGACAASCPGGFRRAPERCKGEPIFGDANVLRSIRQLATTADNLPLGQAKAIRSTLGELGELTDMTPGVAKHQFEQLRRAQDVAIGQAAADPAVAPAINLLRSLDSTYAEGIRKFKDAALNRMVNQAKTGIAPDPGRVAADVLKPEQSARAAEIKKMVGPDVWRRVGAADWQNVMATATDVQTGEVSARRLAAAIKARDRGVGDANLLNLTYGPHIANDMPV